VREGFQNRRDTRAGQLVIAVPPLLLDRNQATVEQPREM
jgi:hypothetical protein